MVTFETIWARIKEHEGETFQQIRGGEFKYTIAGSSMKPDRTNQNIPRTHLEKAFLILPLKNTVPIHHLRGPAYIFAVLMDRRIRKVDW